MLRRHTKRAITLIEIIVVMLLIATITGAVAYNYRESLNQGKIFKAKEATARIATILNMELAERPDEAIDIKERWKEVVRGSPLVSDPKHFMLDPWGGEYKIDIATDAYGQQSFLVTSGTLSRYSKSNQR